METDWRESIAFPRLPWSPSCKSNLSCGPLALIDARRSQQELFGPRQCRPAALPDHLEKKKAAPESGPFLD